MKLLLKYLFLVFVGAFYILASIGFGVHTCSKSGSSDLLLFNSNKECRLIHSNCGCGSSSCHNQQHSKDCCETHIVHLDSDVEVLDGANYLASLLDQLSSLIDFWITPSIIESTVDNLVVAIFGDTPLPPILLKNNLTNLSVWRL